MDLKSWASSVAQKGQQLAREGFTYVERKIEETTQTSGAQQSGTTGSRVAGLFRSSFSLNDKQGVAQSTLTSDKRSIVVYTVQIADSASFPPSKCIIPPNNYRCASDGNLWFNASSPEQNIPGDLHGIYRQQCSYPVPISTSCGASDIAENAFLLPNGMLPEDTTTGCFRSLFPLVGNCHFRFKCENPSTVSGYIWVDSVDATAHVPTYKGCIVCKVLMLPSGVYVGEHISEVSDGLNKHASVQSQGDSNSTGKNNDVERFSESTNVACTSFSRTECGGSEGYFQCDSFTVGVTGNDKTHISAPSAPASGRLNLLHDKKGVQSRSGLSEKKDDINKQRVKDRVLEAQERRQQEALRQKEKLDLPEGLRVELDNWAKNLDGSFKDVRALLSTLHEVLWDESNWERVPMSTLVISSQVKKHFRKALLLSHPDKHQNANAERQFRAERVFHTLNESWKSTTL